jgi:hypothetical protein
MDAAQFFQGLSQLGLGGIVFAIWYFDKKERDGTIAIIKEQINDKLIMREERLQLIRIVEEHGKLMERVSEQLRRLEDRSRRRV